MNRLLSEQTVPEQPGQSELAPSRLENRYGRFAAGGSEFQVTDWRTPRPWVNVIANPRMGLVVSQTGSGFSWIDNSQLAVLTRWHQDLCQDASGKFLYVRDRRNGQVWTLSPAPTWPDYASFACHHGLGYTTFRVRYAEVQAEWTLFVDAERSAEYWLIDLENLAGFVRDLEVCAYLEWNCGVAPSPRREFHRLFMETEFDCKSGVVFAANHMWDVASGEFGHWNTSFPYVAAFVGTLPVQDAQGDKTEFLGRYGDPRAPIALAQERWNPRFGRHEDAIAAIRSRIRLMPSEHQKFGYVLSAGLSRGEVGDLMGELRDLGRIENALEGVRDSWAQRLAPVQIRTPDESIDILANSWLPYQVISGRMWGRCGYYQQSGAYGFRDQLQDSQFWLLNEPDRCLEQIKLHAEHQFADGSVYHWWHPVSEQGLVSKATDGPLWIPFVLASYLKETGRFDVLEAAVPFAGKERPLSLLRHVELGFDRVFSRMSPRGLPLLGGGDWNDGLNAAGLREQGESIWLAEFLVYVLNDWETIYRRIGNVEQAVSLADRRKQLIQRVNELGWDGQWYVRGTLDDGTVLGSSRNRVARIFLNAQTWALLADVAPLDRAEKCMAAVREHLVTEAGPLLLAPPFDQPVQEIGYITRYAPGLRENGGVYTHAATWAIMAACKMGDTELLGALLKAINPTNKDPDRYWAEPYVLPGNVDGPDSPYFGRAGWTWYTGSAAWLHRVLTHWVLGVRPEWDGLRIQPCLPQEWTTAAMVRRYRNAVYDIRIEKDGTRPTKVVVDGSPLPGNVIPNDPGGGRHWVVVQCA